MSGEGIELTLPRLLSYLNDQLFMVDSLLMHQCWESASLLIVRASIFDHLLKTCSSLEDAECSKIVYVSGMWRRILKRCAAFC